MGLQRAGIIAMELKKEPPKEKITNDPITVAMYIDTAGVIRNSVNDKMVDPQGGEDYAAATKSPNLKDREVINDPGSGSKESDNPPIEPQAEVKFLSDDAVASRNPQQVPKQSNSTPMSSVMGQKGGPPDPDGHLPPNDPLSR
jgi:hypothetical protein